MRVTFNKIGLYISCTTIFQYIGISGIYSNAKYIGALFGLTVLFLSIWIILNNRKLIKWGFILPFLFLITFLPTLRILIATLNKGDLMLAVDSFFIYGLYYQLPIIGLAGAVLVRKDMLARNFGISFYVYFFFILGHLMAYYSLNYQRSIGGVGLGYLAQSNMFIPLTMLLFLRTNKKYKILGLFSLSSVFYYSILQNSRSYIIVALLILLFYIFYLMTQKNKLTPVLFLLFIISGMYSILFISPLELLQTTNIWEKFAFDDLWITLAKITETGDLSQISSWKGNSRAIILTDAFHDFSIVDWFWGKGILAKYKSFVERSTIEIGWIQDLFRFGLLYIFVILSLLTKAIINAKRKYNVNRHPILFFIFTVMSVKLLDGFIYGIPELSFYNYLVFSGIMIIFVRNRTY